MKTKWKASEASEAREKVVDVKGCTGNGGGEECVDKGVGPEKGA